MIVMFILMVAPILAIPVFWLLSLGQAIIIYLVALALSGSMFWLMRGNHHRPVTTGKESLIGKEAKIIGQLDGYRPKYTLMIDGELWTARSEDTLKPGRKVVITASQGNTLIVRQNDTASQAVINREEGTSL